MHFIALMHLWLAAPTAKALPNFTVRDEVCGLYLVEDYNDIATASLTVFDPSDGHQTRYTFRGASSPTATAGMMSGQCYCVFGGIGLDPAFHGDRDFLTLNVERVNNGPFAGCSSLNRRR